MSSRLRLAPRHALFCHVLIASVIDPREAFISFGRRLLARRVSGLGGGC